MGWSGATFASPCFQCGCNVLQRNLMEVQKTFEDFIIYLGGPHPGNVCIVEDDNV